MRFPTFTLWWEVGRCIPFRSVKSNPSSFNISTDCLQFIWLISSILLMQASTWGLYFSTHAADDAITAKSPKTSTISPDNLYWGRKLKIKWTCFLSENSVYTLQKYWSKGMDLEPCIIWFLSQTCTHKLFSSSFFFSIDKNLLNDCLERCCCKFNMFW